MSSMATMRSNAGETGPAGGIRVSEASARFSSQEDFDRYRRLVGVVLSVALYAASAFAQQTATISGIVRDTSGAVLAGVVVDAVVAGRAVATAMTGEDGRYDVHVPAGVPLELRMRRDGFADQVVHLPGVAGTSTRDVAMQIGGVSDTLVVTASRSAESRATITQSASVATATDIAALGSTSLADVIRFVPGVNVEGTGREGSIASLFSRGGESDYNLVLIDGVRANANGGHYDFSRISAGDIERVEVVRGAQSSLWGSDAIGSVVQVFTKRSGPADAPTVSGSLEGGSFNTWRGDAHLRGGARRRLDYQLGASHRRTDGAFADMLPENDAFEQSGADGGLGITLGPRASLRTSLRYNNAQGSSVGPITYGARDSGGGYDTKELSWTMSLSHTLGARFSGGATGSYFRYDTGTFDGFINPPYGTYTILEGTPDALFPDGSRLVRLIDLDEFNALSAAGATPAPGQFLASRLSTDSISRSLSKLRRPGARYQGDYTWATGQRLSGGYEWEREANPLVSGFSLDNHAVFVQQQFNVRDRWFFAVGARSDSKERYDTFLSPKLSAGGYLLPFQRGAVSSVKVFVNVGKGIKSPSFAERFGSGFADPNLDLEVERARTADVGVEATLASERLRGAVIYFDNDYRDQIAYRSGLVGDGLPEYINIDGSKASGWEVELALQRPAAGFTAAGNYALVDTKVVTSISTSQQFQPGQPLLRRPRHSGTFRAAYTAGRATINFNLRMVGQRHDNSFLSLRTVPNAARPVPTTTDITVNPAYTVAGLGIDLRAHASLTLFLRGDNIGDTQWESALGYPGLPRSVVAGARFVMGGR